MALHLKKIFISNNSCQHFIFCLESVSTLLAEVLPMLSDPPSMGAPTRTDKVLTCRVAYSSLGGRQENRSHSPHFNCRFLPLLISGSTLPAFGWVVELLITDPRRLSLGTSLGVPLRERRQQTWATSNCQVLHPHHESPSS